MTDRFGPLDMAKGPKGQYRPNDPVAAAAAVIRIATGESDEKTETARALAADRAEKSQSKPARFAKAKPAPIDR